MDGGGGRGRRYGRLLSLPQHFLCGAGGRTGQIYTLGERHHHSPQRRCRCCQRPAAPALNHLSFSRPAAALVAVATHIAAATYKPAARAKLLLPKAVAAVAVVSPAAAACKYDR